MARPKNPGNRYTTGKETEARQKNAVALARREAELVQLPDTPQYHDARMKVLQDITRIENRAERQEAKREKRVAQTKTKFDVLAERAAAAKPEAPARYYPGTDIETKEYLSYVAVKCGLPPDHFEQPYELVGGLTPRDIEWLEDFEKRRDAASAAQEAVKPAAEVL